VAVLPSGAVMGEMSLVCLYLGMCVCMCLRVCVCVCVCAVIGEMSLVRFTCISLHVRDVCVCMR